MSQTPASENYERAAIKVLVLQAAVSTANGHPAMLRWQKNYLVAIVLQRMART